MVMGRDSRSEGRGFESRHRILDGHFFTYICCKNCNVCLKRPKINEKEAGVGPFKKKKNNVCTCQNVALNNCLDGRRLFDHLGTYLKSYDSFCFSLCVCCSILSVFVYLSKCLKQEYNETFNN